MIGTGKPYEVNEINVHVWYILRIGCTPHERPWDLKQCWPGSSVGLGAVLAWEQCRLFRNVPSKMATPILMYMCL